MYVRCLIIRLREDREQGLDLGKGKSHQHSYRGTAVCGMEQSKPVRVDNYLELKFNVNKNNGGWMGRWTRRTAINILESRGVYRGKSVGRMSVAHIVR